MRNQRSKGHRRRPVTTPGFGFIAPSLVLLTVLVVIPIMTGVTFSFTNWQPGYESPFVGLSNYAYLFSSPTFHQILANQAEFLIVVPLSTIVALGLAYLLQDRTPLSSVFRTIYFLPSLLPPAVAGIAFVAILSPTGPVNEVLHDLGLDWLATNWLTNSVWVKPVLILVLTWSFVGTGVIILSAAMGTVPREELESARLDGVNKPQELQYVVFPSIRPAVGLYAVLVVVQLFLWSFPWVYVMTAGGPGYASTTLDYDVYRNTIGLGRYGVGAAESVLIVVIIAVVVGAGFLISRERRPVA